MMAQEVYEFQNVPVNSFAFTDLDSAIPQTIDRDTIIRREVIFRDEKHADIRITIEKKSHMERSLPDGWLVEIIRLGKGSLHVEFRPKHPVDLDAAIHHVAVQAMAFDAALGRKALPHNVVRIEDKNQTFIGERA